VKEDTVNDKIETKISKVKPSLQTEEVPIKEDALVKKETKD